MTPWGVRVELPIAHLGRLRLPKQRMRFRDGWVRLGMNADKTRVVATLVDREDRVLPANGQIEAYDKSYRMGLAVELFLTKYNKYQPGESTGNPGQLRIVVAGAVGEDGRGTVTRASPGMVVA